MTRRVDPAHRIARERDAAVARLEDLSRDLDAISDSTARGPDDEHDPEGSTLGFERARVGALRDETLRTIDELDAAAKRLDGGTYGRCVVCGCGISNERLDALPTTPWCVLCASRKQTRRSQ